jgi:hypothetical protein
MAHARVARALALVFAGCQSPATSAPPRALAAAPASPGPSAPEASFEGRRWGTFHSKRFELSLALPDGSAWKIDDHGSHWLKAEHEPTNSTLLLRSWGEDQIVTRKTCYARAKEWNPQLPDLADARLIDDSMRRLFVDREARVAAGVREAVGVGDAAPEPSAGFVVVVAGDVRRCMVIVYETRAEGGDASIAIADRLAFVTDRVLPLLTLDPSFAPRREQAPPLGVGKAK